MADHAGFDPSELYLYRGKGSIPRNAVRVEVHRSVEFIPDDLFRGCDQLESVLLHDGLLKIGEHAFGGCSSLRSFLCPSTVTEIGRGAFYRCSSLTLVDLPEGLESIERAAFWGCTSLEELQIPTSVARIGRCAFGGCTNLVSVEFREGLLMIGNSAFSGCRSLGSLRIPSSVVEIRECAFNDCSNLSSVELHEHLQTIKRGAFRGCPLESFWFARLSERMEAISMDYAMKSMFDIRLREMTHTLTGGDHGDREEAEAFWKKCRMILGTAHEVLTYLELKGAAPVLELALWKIKIEGEVEEGMQGYLVNHVGGPLSREDCRVKCGAGIMFSEVLKFFAYSARWPRLDD